VVLWSCDPVVLWYRYDHYVAKLASLKAEHEATLRKGKQPTPKEIDRLKRNEAKYEEAKRNYEVLNEQVCAELRAMWEARFEVVDPIFTKIVATETLFLVTFSKELFTLSADLKRVAIYKQEAAKKQREIDDAKVRPHRVGRMAPHTLRNTPNTCSVPLLIGCADARSACIR
jgi:hypothetical protein